MFLQAGELTADSLHTRIGTFHSFVSQVDLDKLQKITGMPSKAAANAKWWRIKQKYMYKATAPQKRKSDGDGDDENDSVAKPKPVKTPRKTKATKNNAKLKDEDDELDAKVDKKTEATAAPEALDNSRV